MKRIIDSHVHLDMIGRRYPSRIQWLKENSCGVVSWSFFEGVEAVLQLERCLRLKAQIIGEYSAFGLSCYYLAGIHPRCIPPDLKPEQIASLLESHMEDPLCRGIGEIGLETGDTREQEMFMAQLEFGRSQMPRKKIIGVHTPRSNKLSVTAATLKILDSFKDVSSSLVIDHCTSETIGAVLDAGFWAGVSLSPIKTSWDEMKDIVSIYSSRVDRIMCNTDSAVTFYEDVVEHSRSDDMPESIREKIFYDNAARFFTIQ
jgi:uncharacterized protein